MTSLILILSLNFCHNFICFVGTCVIEESVLVNNKNFSHLIITKRSLTWATCKPKVSTLQRYPLYPGIWSLRPCASCTLQTGTKTSDKTTPLLNIQVHVSGQPGLSCWYEFSTSLTLLQSSYSVAVCSSPNLFALRRI